VTCTEVSLSCKSDGDVVEFRFQATSGGQAAGRSPLRQPPIGNGSDMERTDTASRAIEGPLCLDCFRAVIGASRTVGVDGLIAEERNDLVDVGVRNDLRENSRHCRAAVER
jgi:hypothetical protein